MRINFRLIWESQRIKDNQFQSYLRITENQFQTYSRITKNCQESISDWFENHWESMTINEDQFQTDSKITKNHWESISDWFENHWESILDWSENHQESLRITENQFQTDSRIAENQWESISYLFENCQVSTENHQESMRINFRLIWESLRITKNKVLPLQWSKAKWHRYMKITIFIVIIIDSHWFFESFSFSHSVKSTGIDHIAVLADINNQYKAICIWTWNKLRLTFIYNLAMILHLGDWPLSSTAVAM